MVFFGSPIKCSSVTIVLSSQQKAAIDCARVGESFILGAVAGSGKTFTLKVILKTLKAENNSIDIAFCAFNKKIVTEIESGLPSGLCSVGTLHSFGFGAIRRNFPRVKVDSNKIKIIARDEFNGEYEILRTFAVGAAAMAKEIGIGVCVENTYNNWAEMCERYDLWDTLPNISEEEGLNAANYLLRRNNEIRNIIDFSDMLYFPILFNLKMTQFDCVLLDEAQDTNGPRRFLVKSMLKPKGQLIAVGDPHQAIYGFTGADYDSLDHIKRQFNCKTLPLSVTYRCPKNIVQVAQKWVTHIQSAPDAPEGIVDSCNVSDIAKLATADDVIICRNTKPLVELTYGLIRKGIACRVEGRSIGEGLIKLAQRWKVKSVGELSAKLTTWAENEIKKYKEKDNLSRCQVIEDQVTTLEVFIDQCDRSESVDVLIGKIRKLFGDTEGVQNILTLSTIHKAKGREWDRVFALGMDVYSPSKWAVKPWQMEQEDNLCYVQVTRAKRHLTMVNVPTKEV